MLTSAGATYTRVAVVQLAYHPAALVDRRSPLEDPLFDPRGGPDPLLPAKGEVPDALAGDLAALRTRIRNAHNDQLLAKLRAALAACRAWGARIVVLPEYSVPWEILGGVADAAGEMVVVAGTHAVDREARRSGVYERLVAPAVPAFGQAVCPVLHRGRLLGLQPKLHPAVPERGSMKAGDRWEPIAMPEGLPGPLGVMVCLDFLYRESEAHVQRVAGPLAQCRFLAVPSLTPHYTMPEFAGKAWEEARRYGRPVLYCDGAGGGGTAIYVDEGQAYDLRRFPDRAGYLEAGDEGVIVADVNLGYERPGGSTRYAGARPVVPVAEATFVYTAHPAGRAYAEWLEGVGDLLAREDDEAVEALDEKVKKGREVLLNAGALTGAAARGRRLKRLLGEIDKVTRVEEVRQFTREVVLPEGVLPLAEVRRAMAAGAGDVVFEWMKRAEVRAAGFGEVEARLREAGKGAAGAIAAAVRGVVEEEKAPVVEGPVRVVLPEGVDPAALGVQRHGGWVLSFGRRPGDLWTTVVAPHILEGTEGPMLASVEEAGKADDLYDLAVARGAERVTAVSAIFVGRSAHRLLIIASFQEDKWALWPVSSVDAMGTQLTAQMLSAFVASGLRAPVLVPIRDETLAANIIALAPAFEGAREFVRALRDQRLREVDGQFVEPDATVGGHLRAPALDALDTWLGSNAQTALVLGEFGTGKSTVLAAWAHRRWERRRGPIPILVNLAGVGAHASPEALLLQAARVDDLPKCRAALRLLVRRGHLVPCFDGFDEMATRLEAAELAGRLSALIEVAAGGGKVLISSRTNYFPSRDHLRTAADAALAQALGASAGLLRIELQPFSDEQVKALVRKIRTEAGAAERALDRIAGIYDLRDLVHRPLLLGMVLSTLDTLDTGKRVGRADLYEAYLGRWLDQTRKDDPECFTDAQKMAFAEALAEELWRSGEPSCTWQALQKSVRMRLVPELREGVPVGAALLEMQGGAFFVHEGEDRYRFAHKSFLEYFLARALVATVADRPAEVLATKPITAEVAEFVGEILERKGDPHEVRAVQAVSAWLRVSSGTTPIAAANALRLLLGMSRWADDGKTWIPAGADLRRVVLVKEDLRGASLVRADLSGADLSGADLSGADLSGADLSGARFVAVRLEKAKLVGVKGRGADFTLAEVDAADLTTADLSDAVLRQSTWTGCSWSGSCVEGAEVTACVMLAQMTPIDCIYASASVDVALSSGHGHVINAIAWSPDGGRLVSTGNGGVLHIWNAKTGRELGLLIADTDYHLTLAWHPDGTRIASGGFGGVVRIWDSWTGKSVVRLNGHKGAVSSVAWEPTGQRLASSGFDGTIRLWDAATGAELTQLNGHSDRVECVAWDPSGRCLASAGSEGDVRLWDVEQGDCHAVLSGHRGWVSAVAWHPQGRYVASAGADRTVRLWNASTGKLVGVLQGHSDCVKAIAWNRDGDRFASAGDDGTIRLWHPERWHELSRLECEPLPEPFRWLRHIKAFAWSPEGTLLASGGTASTLCIWAPAIATQLMRFEGHYAGAGPLAWSPDGVRLACVGGDCKVRIWDTTTGKELTRIDGISVAVLSVAWSSDGERLVIAENDQSVSIWDARTGLDLGGPVLQEKIANSVNSVAFSPRRERLGGGGTGGSVRVWDAVTGSELAHVDGHEGGALTAAWHPQGEVLASSGRDSMIKFWDSGALRELARTTADAPGVLSLAWSPDGRYVAGGGSDGTVRVWDPVTGGELMRVSDVKHNNACVAWHSDGMRLVSGGSDGVVKVWDVRTQMEIARLECDVDAIHALSWSSDGRRLAVAVIDNTIVLWDMEKLMLLGTFLTAGEASITRTPAGFCILNDTPSIPARLALRRPESGSRTALYVPLAGLRSVLHRPDKVRAALSGDLSGDDIRPELERLGWANGVPWDGKAHRLPAAPVPVPALTPAPAPSPAFRENPFSPGPALTGELPPGREPVIQQILALLSKKRPAPAILRGPRRSGKTSLLHHLCDRLAATHRVRFITLEGRTTPLVTADDLARVVEPSLASKPSPADTLRKRLQRPRAHKNSVLLIDEVANLAGADASLFAWLRAVGQEGTGVLLAGSHWDWVRVVERAASIMPGSSFGNDVTPVTLGPLREPDALQFLVDAAPPDVPLARDGTARWILDLCGPWPFYLQVMGFSIVQAVREGARKALVERVGVGDIYEQQLLLDRSDGYFKTRWAELPERARSVLDTIRTLPPRARPIYRDLPPEDRLVLRDTGLCSALGAWLVDEPFFDWIVRIKDDGRR